MIACPCNLPTIALHRTAFLYNCQSSCRWIILPPLMPWKLPSHCYSMSLPFTTPSCFCNSLALLTSRVKLSYTLGNLVWTWVGLVLVDVLTGLQVHAERVQMGLCMARQYVYFLEKLSSTHYANFTWNSQYHEGYFATQCSSDSHSRYSCHGIAFAS